jgi:hypothetical protein
MSVAIDATPGGVSANSYCTVAEADTYHGTRLNSDTWTNAGADLKAQALVMATRTLDSHIYWSGIAVNRGIQALQWPRAGMIDLFLLPIPYTVVPQILKNATAEFARQLIEGDRLADAQSDGVAGLTSMEVGPIRMGFNSGGPKRKVIPDVVYEMLSQWILQDKYQNRGTARLVRA